MTLAWMAYGTIVSAAIGIAAWGIDAWLRTVGRPTRFLWLGAMVGMALVLVGAAIRPRAVPDISVGTSGIVHSVERTARPAVSTASLDLAALGWGGASMLVLLGIVGGIAALVRARRRGVRTTWLGTPVIETDEVGPGAAPWGDPAIFVPRSLKALPEPSARLLLDHEREHVAAGDARLLLAAAGLLVLLPWNLPLWWCFRRLRTAIECDCDARVLRNGVSLGDYASLLLDLAAPRLRPLPALLSFATSRSQLHTRIDAMTTRPTLSRTRRIAMTALVASAALAACETRMPAPVAPVADYVVKEGKASPVTITGENRDSVRASLVEGVELSLSAADTSMDPVLVVRDATGAVVYSGRVTGARDSTMAGIAPDAIESVEVIKGKAALPEGARGGMIVMRLKPGAAWQGLSSRAPSSLLERPVAPATASGVRVRVRGDTAVTLLERPVAASGDTAAAAAGGTVRIRARSRDGAPTVELLTSRRADSSGTRVTGPGIEPMVSVIDAEGREVVSARGMGREVDGQSTIGGYRIAVSDIARVEVFKGASAPEGGLIQVHLKVGAKPVKP